MKKIFALAIIAIFMLSLMPGAFSRSLTIDTNAEIKGNAETNSNNNNNSERLGARAEAKAEAKELRESYKERLKLLKETQRAKLEALSAERAEMFANLSSDRLEKIAELDKRQIERLSELNIKNLEKISRLKGERLERLAELEKDKLERISNLNESDIEKVSVLGRAKLKEVAKLDVARIKAELKSIKIHKVKNADELNEKNVTNEEIASLRQRFEGAKEKFNEAKDELKNEREKLNEAKKKGDEKSALEHAKNYLLRAADALINHLEKIKAKVQESPNINDETEVKIVAEIDAQISEINSIKAEVQAATTKEQVKDIAKKLRSKWNSIVHLIRLYSGRVVSARVEGIVNQGLVLEKQLDNVLQKAKERGINVSVSAEMELFSQKIAASRDKFKQAQDKLTEALGLRAKGEPAESDKLKVLIEESNQLLKESRDSLKEAHDLLKTIVKKIKAAYPQADLSADVEVEVAEETSSSTN